MDYCKIMRDLREDADLTQQQVADVLGTSQTMYARYERGANELPIHHLITLCRFYHVTSDYFLGLAPKSNAKITRPTGNGHRSRQALFLLMSTVFVEKW